jgi:hypothetical protein
MNRLAAMILPLAAATAMTVASAQAADVYERVGANNYKPVRGATYSSTCCYKKIIKQVTVTKAVWVKVAPPKPHRPHDDDDAPPAPRPTPASHHRPQVVLLGEVIHRGDGCRKAVPVRDRSTTVIVMIDVSCR